MRKKRGNLVKYVLSILIILFVVGVLILPQINQQSNEYNSSFKHEILKFFK